ncbi:MAG: hypothetical protein ACLR43_09835 [Faecalibacillus faecis]
MDIICFICYIIRKTNLLADKLNTDLASSSVCGYEWGGTYYADYDTTGWVIEGLAVVNKEKYATTINKAIDYIKIIQQ